MLKPSWFSQLQVGDVIQRQVFTDKHSHYVHDSHIAFPFYMPYIPLTNRSREIIPLIKVSQRFVTDRIIGYPSIPDFLDTCTCRPYVSVRPLSIYTISDMYDWVHFCSDLQEMLESWLPNFPRSLLPLLINYCVDVCFFPLDDLFKIWADKHKRICIPSHQKIISFETEVQLRWEIPTPVIEFHAYYPIDWKTYIEHDIEEDNYLVILDAICRKS